MHGLCMGPLPWLIIVSLSLACLACKGEDRDAGDDAIEPRLGAAQLATLDALRREIESDPAALQRVLLDPRHEGGLRDSRAFRSLIDDAARRHGISKLRLVREDEPGEPLVLEGLLRGPDGRAVPGAVVRLFATDAEGRYHPTIEGERRPRIFGTVVSDDKGRFEVTLVRPGPYPGTRQARHIHISARAGSRRLAAPGYAVFDDDPLLDEPQNAEQRGEAIRIRMRREPDRAIGSLELSLR